MVWPDLFELHTSARFRPVHVQHRIFEHCWLISSPQRRSKTAKNTALSSHWPIGINLLSCTTECIWILKHGSIMFHLSSVQYHNAINYTVHTHSAKSAWDTNLQYKCNTLHLASVCHSRLWSWPRHWSCKLHMLNVRTILMRWMRWDALSSLLLPHIAWHFQLFEVAKKHLQKLMHWTMFKLLQHISSCHLVKLEWYTHKFKTPSSHVIYCVYTYSM